MKKIFFICILLLCLGGCTDYKEVNDLAIIKSVGIDYKDEEYYVTLEVLNNKINKNSEKVTSYTRTGHDKNIAFALEKAADELSLRSYYSHVKLIIFSESVAKEKLEDIIDFLVRSTYLRENFHVVISSNDCSPEEMLNIKSEENPIPGEAIMSLIQNNEYASNYAVYKNFILFLEEILDFGTDVALSVINEKDNNFYIDGLAIFNHYKMVTTLDNDQAVIYNLIQGNISKPIFSVNYDGKSFDVAIYNAKTEFEVTKDKINVTGSYKAKIIANTPNVNIRNSKKVKKLNKDFTKLINNKITEFIKLSQEYDSDILGLANTYYISTRDKNDKLWQHAKIESKTKVNINKKGLIYKEYENN